MRTEPLDSFSAHTVAPVDTGTALRLDPSRTALLVVDMLNDFCEPGGAMVLPGAERLYPPTAALVRATRGSGAIVWVCDRHEGEADAEFRKRTPHFRDFDVYVPADACAATGAREQESTLYDIGTHFGTVTDVASVLTALGRAD